MLGVRSLTARVSLLVLGMLGTAAVSRAQAPDAAGTAKLLGLTMPPEIMVRATRVIQ